ncbi:MAG: sensor histidine kinase [Clostridia bacterium]|nr:sensor histidine kinase [Clostridia bacterium]
MKYLWLLLLLPVFLLFRWFLLWYANRQVEKKLAEWQTDLVTRHFDEVDNMYRKMRGWRHDYHSHIQSMKAMLSLGQTEKLADYLSGLDHDLVTVDTVIKTGNVMVDAILNSKLSLAAAREIAVNAKATVPENLTVTDVDLCVILGNLMDNAIEANQPIQAKEDRFIRVYIGKHKDMFYISVSNAVGGKLNKRASGHRNPIYTTTKGTEGHGFGLLRIDKIVEKYGGFVDRQNEEGVFATEVMLPL